MTQHFSGKVAIVTGGGSGIGREIVLRLARQGAITVIAGRNERAARKVQKLTQTCPVPAEVFVLDMTDPVAVEKLMADTVKKHGTIDYLFNCVGIVQGGEVKDTPLVDAIKVIDTNLHSVINGTHFAYRQMIAQGSGHIINFASAAGLLPTPTMSFYTASKYGIVGFSHALRAEAKQLGVNVSVVCPGFVKTPIYETALYNNLDKEKTLTILFHKIPIQTPEAAAKRILSGVRKNKLTIHTWYSLRFVWLIYRFSPGLYVWLTGPALTLIRKRLEIDNAPKTKQTDSK